MPDQTTKSKSLAKSPSGEAQPHKPSHEISLRLRRKRSSPDDTTPNSHRKASSQSRRSQSIRSNSSGPHRSRSRNRQPKMPSASSSAQSGLTSPKFTKTGRISKAKKGVKGAHVCICGKVSSLSAPSVFPRLWSVGEPPQTRCLCVSVGFSDEPFLYHKTQTLSYPPY
jgi:hypothetical protein